MRLARMMLGVICVLPLLGIARPNDPSALVASYIPSCDASAPRPRLRTHFTAAGRPERRPDTAAVAVFERGTPPARQYAVLGDVSVLASGSRTSVEELTRWAKRGARELGGDALVDVQLDDAASAKPPAGPVGLLYLSATVVRWE